MMTRREVMRTVFEGKAPPYVPWSYGFTHEARQKLAAAVPAERLAHLCDGHTCGTGSGIGVMTPMANERYQDAFGVVWDRSVDKDIGVVEGVVLADGTLDGYSFPDPLAEVFVGDLERLAEQEPDLWRVHSIGFSLFERAWTLRGMENLLMDFYERPQFVHDLLTAIADWNIVQVKRALEYDIDAVYYGDDWGQQQGLIMGPALWREFILPQLRRMYGVVREAGRYVMIHSCGDVDDLFEDLIDAGLNCFNPFQPEVMDVWTLLPAYRGRLCFHGGLSTQKTLPYGTAEEVRDECERLLSLGRAGGYIFAPAHAVEGDVPVENMLAFMEVVHAQAGV